MNSWGNPVQGFQQPPSTLTGAAAATAKGINTAVAAVATLYNDKCRPAHEGAVQASQAVAGVRSALTAYLRQGAGAQGRLPSLEGLGPAQLKSLGGSYRWQTNTTYHTPIMGNHETQDTYGL